MQKIAQRSKWENRFADLLKKYPEITLGDFGFPPNYNETPLWNNSPLLEFCPKAEAE